MDDENIYLEEIPKKKQQWIGSCTYDRLLGRIRWRNTIPAPGTGSKTGSLSVRLSEEEAESKLQEIRVEIALRGYWAPSRSGPGKAIATFESVCEAWLAFHQMGGMTTPALEEARENGTKKLDSIPVSILDSPKAMRRLWKMWREQSRKSYDSHTLATVFEAVWHYGIKESVPGLPVAVLAPPPSEIEPRPFQARTTTRRKGLSNSLRFDVLARGWLPVRLLPKRGTSRVGPPDSGGCRRSRYQREPRCVLRAVQFREISKDPVRRYKKMKAVRIRGGVPVC